ncbi:hypothetical protein ABTK33_20045, partial [Acinetobacter baumannii]
ADAAAQVERVGEPLRVVADILVLLDGPDETAAARLERLDAAGRPHTPEIAASAGDPFSSGDPFAVAGESVGRAPARPAVDAIDLAAAARALREAAG